MRAAIPSRVTSLVCGLALLVGLGGCGSSAPKPDTARVARLVAEANTVCGSVAHQKISAQKRVEPRERALARALEQAAAYLPAGRSLEEANAKWRALTVEAHKAGSLSLFAPNVIERSYRIRLQIYDDLKALGLSSCLGPRPRAPISG